MIVDAILTLFFGALGLILDLLPVWDPIDLSALWALVDSGPGASVFGFFGWANYYVPITEGLAILQLQLAIWATVYVVRFVIWLLQLFHIAGGGS